MFVHAALREAGVSVDGCGVCIREVMYVDVVAVEVRKGRRT